MEKLKQAVIIQVNMRGIPIKEISERLNCTVDYARQLCHKHEMHFRRKLWLEYKTLRDKKEEMRQRKVEISRRFQILQRLHQKKMNMIQKTQNQKVQKQKNQDQLITRSKPIKRTWKMVLIKFRDGRLVF